ncbi:MAG: phage tail assembly protein [Rhizobiales bacterium]|nr:phage tail assembly protein [Hyphomicrobiales bacterium]
MADDDTKPLEQVNGAKEPSAEQLAAAAQWDGRLQLRKNVIANGETVDHIVFREPTGGDIERIGNPLTVGMYESNPKIHFESQTMTLMMAHLAGVPPSTIRALHPKDWENGAWKIANFFIPDSYG